MSEFNGTAVAAQSSIFDREIRAGLDPERMARAVIVVVGAGAAGSNLLQTFALLGAGEVRIVDFDHVEPSNVTRMPLLAREAPRGGKPRFKAREAAARFVALSYAGAPAARYAVERVEAVGEGAFADAAVVVSAVDSQSCRAYLADVTRRLGVPLVELGFESKRGQVSAFANASGDEPCWRCLHPRVAHGSFSCTHYARALAAQGRIPATQTVAAVFANLAAEAALGFIHGDPPLAGSLFHLDIRTGASLRMGVSRDPACPGAHARLGAVEASDVSSAETVAALLGRYAGRFRAPALRLPAAYVVEAPCARCGAGVEVGAPAWRVDAAPTCRECPRLPRLGGAVAQVATAIAAGDALASLRLRDVGLGPMAYATVEDAEGGERACVRLAGTLDDVFTLVARAAANGTRRRATETPGDESVAPPTQE